MINDNVAQLLKSGFLYISGRDRNYRPLFCLRSSRILNMNPLPSPEDLISATVVFFEYARKFMQVPGKIENVVIIINSLGGNVFTMPYALVNKVLGVITSNYKCVARSIIVLNAPRAFAYAWKTISYFLDENTARKVQISYTPSTPELLELVAPNQLEQQFGGQAKDREAGEFWPPKCPDLDFGAEAGQSEQILDTEMAQKEEEKYQDLIKDAQDGDPNETDEIIQARF